MNDYINRNNAIECIENEVIRITKMLLDSCETRNLIKGAKDSIDTLKHMPSVDAVEVVRCKNCKHKQEYGKWLECRKFDIGVDEDFFCKDGDKE